MYFQKLENLSQQDFFKSVYPIIDAIDTWLALLPKSYKDRILPETMSHVLKVPLKIIYRVFDELLEVDMLREKYIIRCPEEGCNHVLYIADSLRDLKNYIDNFNNEECDFCENTHSISSDYIFVIYELIDEPKKDVVKKNFPTNSNLGLVETRTLTERIVEKPEKFEEELGEKTLRKIAPEKALNFVLDELDFLS